MAHQLTDKSKGVYGFVARDLKNANMTFRDDILLKWDQETVTPDGKKLLTDTPAAIEAATWLNYGLVSAFAGLRKEHLPQRR
ncbi:MAG: hypothetical protein JO227_16335 [Acetobacteraceae bacterium]|nr:hypothetical protein [Acetobacteraceae bacterium]